LVQTVAGLERGNIQPTPQNEAEASFAPLLKKEEGRIDWTRPAGEIFSRYRGLTPWPGTFSFLDGRRILLTELALASERTSESRAAGSVFRDERGRIAVACGTGSVELVQVKPEGKSVLNAAEFMRGLAGKEPKFSYA
jgi:methionyl-tRNA formyltransferase